MCNPSLLTSYYKGLLLLPTNNPYWSCVLSKLRVRVLSLEYFRDYNSIVLCTGWGSCVFCVDVLCFIVQFQLRLVYDGLFLTWLWSFYNLLWWATCFVEGSPCFLDFLIIFFVPRVSHGGLSVCLHVCSKLGQMKKINCRSKSPNQCWSVIIIIIIIIIILSTNVWVVFLDHTDINFIVKIMPWITNLFGLKKKHPSIMHKDQFSNIHLESH